MPGVCLITDPPFASLVEREPLLRLENHEVLTNDGYIVTLSRIVLKGEGENAGEYSPVTGEPVLLVHGLSCQGSHWLLNNEEKCLPYILGKSGYDCWIASLRGTELSKKHKSLDPLSMKFWDFSWDEIARYDIPAFINHILRFTGRPQLFYIGHSMGCLVLFTALSIFPELNQKVKKMVALAPASYGRNISNPFVKFFVFLGYSFSQWRRIYSRQVLLERRTMSSIISMFWPGRADKIGAYILSTIGVQFGMFGTKQVESSRLPNISNNWPSTTSLKTIFHVTQLYQRSLEYPQPRAYDYGREGNLRRYGAEYPPIYDLKKVAVPIAIFSSEGDNLVSSRDVEITAKQFKTVTDVVNILDKNFAHVDFMFGKDADEIVFNPLVQILKKAEAEEAFTDKNCESINPENDINCDDKVKKTLKTFRGQS